MRLHTIENWFLSLGATVLLMLSTLVWTSQAIAQDETEDDPSVFLVATFFVDVPEGGSMNELLDMLAEQNDATSDNPHILSQVTLRHWFSADSREIITITEYESLDGMEAAFEANQELIEARWPDEDERDAWQEKLNSYIQYHSDGIYNDIPGLSR